jgi:sugar phosphate isomerase/epimerase
VQPADVDDGEGLGSVEVGVEASACRHEHLPLGSGDVDFPPVLAAFAAGGSTVGLHLELPRQSHCWVETARQSAAFLMPLLQQLPPQLPPKESS